MSGGTVLALGEVLVEIMRPERDVPLGETGDFRGPFASGAPAIFAGAAARLGAPVRFAGVRGDDAFGELCARELSALGVDVRGLRTVPETTGIAFVGYRSGGAREFLFHLPRSAAALLGREDVTAELLDGVGWLHVTGSSLAVSESVREACVHAVGLARERGATVSFDPNLRLELMEPGAIERLCGPILDLAQVVLPSGGEASLLAGEDDPADACRALLERGPELVLRKLGADGCEVYSADGVQRVSSIAVDEVDPTGAGDCFAAGFAAARLGGADANDAARFANVVGALSTTALGPLSAAPTRAEVEARLGEA